MRHELCEKDGILITYNDDNISFEDTKTAESILFKNDGTILQNNFDETKTAFFQKYFNQIYTSMDSFRRII